MTKTVIKATAFAAAMFAAGCADNSAIVGEDLTKEALAAAEASGFKPAKGGDGGELHIYTWCDYIAPDVIASFEKALGVKIIVDTFDSNEAMYAKLKAGGTGYDLITPTSYQILTMVKEQMIVALDHSKIPNVRKNFDQNFKSQIIDPTFAYNVPYAVTYSGFVYAKDKVPAGADVASWHILENPAYKGRVSLLDDIRETLGGALMCLGYSINSTSEKEVGEAVALIQKWRANVRKFDAESYKTEVPNGSTWLGHGYSTDSTQVIVGDEEAGAPARADIGFALPKEGFSIGFDEFVLAKDAKRKDLAYAFINYIYEPKVAKVNMEFICGPTPVAPGIALLEPEYRKLIVLDVETLKHGQVIRGFEDRPDVMDIYNRAWDKVKASSDAH